MPKYRVLSDQSAVASPPLDQLRRPLSYLRHVLPQGRTLPDDVWRRRHRALLALLWAHAAGLPLFGILQGYGIAHTFAHGSVLAAAAILATLMSGKRKIAGALVSLGLITSSALLVHIWNGVIEGHFHFFVMIVLLSLYEDWVPFLLAAAYVVVHHGLTGALDPGAVYNHPDAVAHPWKWAAIHGLFVTAAGIGSVVTWRLNEDLRAESRRAQEQLAYQALHDSLTGLPNRRRLLVDLERRLTEATRAEPTALLLFDLDGFKAYNDTYGHLAGDSLLVRLGRNLTAALGDRGSPYRMGGDEFCVMAPIQADAFEGVDQLASVAAAALSERGEGFVVTASYGSVLLPTEATTCSDALRKADQRMYARKNLESRVSAGRQTTDVLLRVLSERNPDLGIHLDRVTQLCRAVAKKFAMPEDELAWLLQAASLHDVGKTAIPDEILAKPGPLDDEEWEFVRRHPVIGERILSAAPALAQAAKLVRSSHERVDGRGYPDGLAGEEILLGARIIAVCDAFDAMTSSRPYRAAMSTEVALSELRRCAGTQFDPIVVDTFEVVLAEQNIEAASPPGYGASASLT
jgi:diguanylate cyclase (GGDEF)-like protein